MSRCIDCYRCVRICDEVQGQGVWHVRDRGLETRIVPDGRSLRESSCVSCGACVDTCPTGALEDAAASPLARRLAWTRTTCPYCGVGCEMNVGTRDGRIVSVRPVLDAPVSKGHLCVKGRYAFDFVHAADRITEPDDPRDTAAGGARRGAKRALSWPAGCATSSTVMAPTAIGVLGSARATNEDNYLAQKFARTVVGTNNIDCCARVCHAPSAAALKRHARRGPRHQFVRRHRAGADDSRVRRESHRRPSDRRRAHQTGGPSRRAADRHRSATDRAGRDTPTCHLAIAAWAPTSPLLNAMAHTIVAEGLCDQRVPGRTCRRLR